MKRVLVVPIPFYGDGARIIYSASKKDGPEFNVKNNFSFAWVAGNYAAEWEPEYGPIQVWHKCEKDAKGAREHYIFPYTDSDNLNWSQLAVSENELPQLANRGDWEYIFSVLAKWAKRDVDSK